MKLGGLDISTVKLGASQVQAIYQGGNLVWQNAPVATAATGIGQTSFTANWETFTGAFYYLLDVSEVSDFSTFVYENQVVEAPTTSYVVIGLNPNTTYYYRVRASTDELLLLNEYPNAAAAYSLRRINGSYTGDAIRVRRASDNTEQDIGFVNNELDTLTLTSFCSGTNGFVKTWYDQSGNGRDATQTTAVNQPQIVSSGSTITENGKPSIDFDGSNDYLTTNLTVNQPMTHIAVAQLNTNTSQTFPVIMSGSDQNQRAQMYNQSTFFGMFAGSLGLISAFAENNIQNLHFGFFNGASSFYSLNASAPVSGDAGTSSISLVQIGSQVNGSYVWDGNIQEAIIYPSDQSSNRTGIETNIKNFYSILSDSDAKAFVDRVYTAGGTLSATEKQAVDTLVQDLKSAGIWTKMKAIYPMVGASAAACAQNLKSSSYTGTFTSGWTFASTGVTPNGTSAFCNTNVPWIDLQRNNNSIGFYSRTNIVASQIDIGVADKYRLFANFTGVGAGGNNFSAFSSVANADSLGFYQNIRIDSSIFKIYKNNSILITANIPTSVDAHPTQKIAIGGQMLENNTGVQNPSSKEFAFAFIGDGLTDTEASNLYTAVQEMQVTLNRNV